MNHSIMRHQQENGFAVLDSLNQLNDADLKALLEQMFRNTIGEPEARYKDILGENSTVSRIIKNQTVEKIEISHYGSLIITWSGIAYKPEHGPEQQIFYMPAYTALSSFLNVEP